MAKSSLRRFKPGELGGVGSVIDMGIAVVLAQPRLQNTMVKGAAQAFVGTLGAGTLGAYLPSEKAVVLSKTEMTKETALHEGAHAIDDKSGWVSSGAPFKSGASGTPAKEWNAILVNRFNRYVAPSDTIKQYSALQRRVSTNYLSYLNSSKERFADAFSQRRTNPTKFASYAPTIASWFRSNIPKL